MKGMYEKLLEYKKIDLDNSKLELKKICEHHKDNIHLLSQESYKLGIEYAMREIGGRLLIYNKANKKNMHIIYILEDLKENLSRRYNGKP